ncbi:MAG: hypothetical protein IPP69_12115 [Flavobacteriales bacterium]|nr:hypothetical protein [Flavobacteriales bacterium]
MLARLFYRTAILGVWVKASPIGFYTNMMYFLEDNTTVVYAVNSNYGKIDPFVSTKEAL